MRLLERRHNGVQFHLFEELKIPPYAILSHTWGNDEDEVTFEDVSKSSGKGRLGYKKIEFCANQVERDNLNFFWVDTCCIDKTTSAELARSINSMFRWYQQATKCYVYLSDVSIDGQHHANQSFQPWEAKFRESRWFTRGWTLQELIAPKVVEFYSSEGKLLGDKWKLKDLIHEITGIPVEILSGGDLSKVPDREKFQWAQSRQTKQQVDMVYSLIGILDIPLIANYGETYDHARLRLKIAIKDRDNLVSKRSEVIFKPDEIKKLFQDAWISFQKLVSNEEGDTFRGTRVEKVRRTIFDLQREQEGKKSLMNWYRLKDFLEGANCLIKLSGSVIDVDSYAEYLWGPMNFMLTTSSHFPELFDAVLSAYEAIGEKISFLVEHEIMFKQYPLMQRILGWIYYNLLEFHVKAQRFFRGNSFRLVFKADWADFDTRFQGILSSLQRHKDLIEYLARFAGDSSSDVNLHILEKFSVYTSDRTKSLEELDKREQEEKDKKYLHVTEWLTTWRPGGGSSKTEQVADHESFCDVRKWNPRCGDWIMRDAKITSWMDDEIPSCPVLWINGIPGAGKTILASRLIEECQNRRGAITSYFYCNESDPQKRDSISTLKGLLVQMVTQNRTLVPYFHMRAKSSGQGTLVAHPLTQSLVKLSCQRIDKQYIIIDGLDECPKDERRILLSFLAEIIDMTESDDSGKLRLLIVSQSEADIAETLARESRTRPNFSMEDFSIQVEQNKTDIEGFVSMWSDRVEQRFGLAIEEKECIQRLMSSRTNGMFLYAKLVLENLYEQATKGDVVAELDEDKFPAGLAEAYKKILGRLERQYKLNERLWNQITHLLGWMICAKRPLKQYEIQCAFCLDLSDEDDTLRDVEVGGLNVEVKKLCGTLIRELPEERLELVHSTARLYLARTQYINKPEIECELASLCLRYLSLDFFDPELETSVVNSRILDGWLSFQDYAVSKWFQHLHALSKIYNEEGFKVEESSEGLQSLYSSLSVFLERHENEITDSGEVPESVRADYHKLADEDTYDPLIRVMSHVTRHMEKGTQSRNEIGIASLKKAFERNRKQIEVLSEESTKKSEDKLALVRYYGPRRFKCSLLTCFNFYNGFPTAKTREKHVNRHNRPWVCELINCTSASFGFSSNKDLEKHKRDYHPDETDLSMLFKLKPKKVIGKTDHVCHICGKNFKRKDIKQDHINAHNGERPHACSECPKTFTRISDRKRHEKIHDRFVDR